MLSKKSQSFETAEGKEIRRIPALNFIKKKPLQHENIPIYLTPLNPTFK